MPSKINVASCHPNGQDPPSFLFYGVTVCLTCPTSIPTSLELVVSTDPAQGIYKENYKPLCSSTLYSLRLYNWLSSLQLTEWMIFTRWNSTADWSEFARSFCSTYLSSLSKNSHVWKTPSVNKEHLFTAHAAKAWESNHIWKEATQHPTHIAWQVHVYKPKQTLPFPLQRKLVNARRQFSLLIFWLPSPRYELRTLAG